MVGSLSSDEGDLPIPLPFKHGLHGGAFAELPTPHAYSQIKATCRQNEGAFWTVDIEPELSLLAHFKEAELRILVPTLGFTDPSQDYSLAPLFAVPVSIHNLLASVENPGLSRAKVFATDISGANYPLLCCPHGRIDYERILQHMSSDLRFFTPLRAITYVYTQVQLQKGQGLHLASETNTHNKVEFLLPPQAPGFTIELTITDKRQHLVHQRQVYYKKEKRFTIGAQMSARWEGEKNGTLHLHHKMLPNKALDKSHRARLVIDIPMEKGIQYHWQSASLHQHEKANVLRLTQFFGLSAKARAFLVKGIIHWESFFKKMLNPSPKGDFSSQGGFNCYSDAKEMIVILYDHLIESVVNQSIPLFALSEFFAEKSLLKKLPFQIEAQAFDLHDGFILRQLFLELEKEETKALDFIDKVDQLLCFAPCPLETTLKIKTSSEKCLPEEVEINAFIELDTKEATKQQTAIAKAMMQIVPKVKAGVDDREALDLQTQEKACKVNLANFVKENDKINLTALLALLENTEEQSILHAKITAKGETEIWIEHFSRVSSKPSHYHVATVKESSNAKALLENLNSLMKHKRS